MVIYLDIAFLLNALADALTLYAAARLAGLPVQRLRLAAAAALGGTYGALCTLPGLEFAAGPLPQLVMAAALVRLAFGPQPAFLRQLLLFLLLSCTVGGALVAGERLLEAGGGLAVLAKLNWGVFFLAGGLCFLLLSLVFRGGARHGAGELRRCRVERRGRAAELTALLDTGHTLTDGLAGRPVLTAHWAALDGLWTEEERRALSRLEQEGAAACLMRLGAGSGFRLLPYKAVGVSSGMLLCFRADRAALGGEALGEITVALSPTAVSDGGGYAALWGGERGREGSGHAA